MQAIPGDAGSRTAVTFTGNRRIGIARPSLSFTIMDGPFVTDADKWHDILGHAIASFQSNLSLGL